MCKEHALQPSVNRNSSCGPDRLHSGEGGAGGETDETEGRKGANLVGVLSHNDGRDGENTADYIWAVKPKSFIIQISMNNHADPNQAKLVRLCQDELTG